MNCDYCIKENPIPPCETNGHCPFKDLPSTLSSTTQEEK